METVSIIIPAYNAGLFIRRAIDSCLRQTYQDLDIIVVDDGSSDNTYDIATSIKDNRVRVIRQENGGVCKARNVGIDASKGKYLFFLDADDELFEDCIESLFVLLEEKTDIVCGTSIKDSGIPNYEAKEKGFNIEKWDGETGLIKSLLDDPQTYAVWNKLYRKSFIGDTRFYEGKKIHEDAFFVFELMTKKPSIVITNQITYLGHVVENSASREAFSDKFYDILFFRDKKIEIVKERFPHLTKYVGNIIVKSDMALLGKLVTTRERKQKEKELIKEIKKYKKSFVPATKANEKFFFVITHGLYFLLKWYKKYF